MRLVVEQVQDHRRLERLLALLALKLELLDAPRALVALVPGVHALAQEPDLVLVRVEDDDALGGEGVDPREVLGVERVTPPRHHPQRRALLERLADGLVHRLLVRVREEHHRAVERPRAFRFRHRHLLQQRQQLAVPVDDDGVIVFDNLVVPRLDVLHLRGDLVGDDADDDGEDEEADEDDALRDETPTRAARRVPLVRGGVGAGHVVE